MVLDEKVVDKLSKTHELEKLENAKLRTTSIASLEVSLQEIHSSCSPSSTEYEYRRSLVHDIDALVKKIYGNVDGYPLVEAFGSFVMDMFTADGDLDLSINFSSSETCPFSRDKKISVLKKFLNVLYANQRKGNLHHLQPILKARVPIIRFLDHNTGIQCDVSIENKDGVTRSMIIFLISSIDERFQILSCLMKLWAKAHDINSAKDHTLNSISIILLVAFHLQTRDPPILPPLSAILKGRASNAEFQDTVNQFKDYGKANKETIAELFVALFYKLLYVETLWKEGICASTYEGSWIPKKWGSSVGIISVEDFLDRSENCARAVTKKKFKMIYRCIRNTIGHISLFTKDQIEMLPLKELLFGRITFHILKRGVGWENDASKKREYFISKESIVTVSNHAILSKKGKKDRTKKMPLKEQITTDRDQRNRKRKHTMDDESAAEAYSVNRPKMTKGKHLFVNHTTTPLDPFRPSMMLMRANGREGSSNQADTVHNYYSPITPIHALNNIVLRPGIGAQQHHGHSFSPSHRNDVLLHQRSSFPNLHSQYARQLDENSGLCYGTRQPPRLPCMQNYNPVQQQFQFPHIPHSSHLPNEHGHTQGFRLPILNYHHHVPGYQESTWSSHLASGQSLVRDIFQPVQSILAPGQSCMPGLQQSQISYLANGTRQVYVEQLQQHPQILSRLQRFHQ